MIECKLKLIDRENKICAVIPLKVIQNLQGGSRPK